MDSDRCHAHRVWLERLRSVAVPPGAADVIRTAVQLAHRAPSLSSLHASRLRATQVHYLRRTTSSSLSGMEFIDATLGTARPVYWLEPGSAAAQPPVSG